MMIPSVVAWLLSTIAYYWIDRRNRRSLVIIQSLVLIYAAMIVAGKYSAWRYWYRP